MVDSERRVRIDHLGYCYKMNINYTNGVLTINDGNVTFVEQPCWPDGTPWTNETEARAWAEILIAWMDDPEQPEPPGGPQ